MISLNELVALFILAYIIYYWWSSSEKHTVALKNARKYCQEREIQLLDDTLSFQKFSRTRVGNKKYFCRVYRFDFCQDGQDRHKGEIVLYGFTVIRVMLETEQLEITQY